jgi:formylglycine-generating enzyme required for sulfatase activity/predicted phosphodiesterase
MSQVTWLHLSDWHQKGKEFDRDVVRDALLKDIENRKEIAPELEKIDFIVFSGDVAQNGKKEEYDAAVEQLFKPLLAKTGLQPENLFIVPGNHDIDHGRFEDLPQALGKPLQNHDEVVKWLGIEKRSKLLDPFYDFNKCVKEFTKQENFGFADSRIITTDNGTRIGLSGLNTSLMCGRNRIGENFVDQNQLIIGEPQVRDAVTKVENECIRIVVLHHPFDFLKEFDRINVEADIKRQFHFILHGHTHRSEVHRTSGTMGDFVIIPAGACYNRRLQDDPNYISSYNFVNINFNDGTGKVFLRKWDETQKEWWKLDARTSPDGVFTFELPNALRVEKRTQIGPVKPKTDPSKYLETLLSECCTIDIRGLKVSDANAHKLDIEKLYTPLHITSNLELDVINVDVAKEKNFLRNINEKVTLDEVLKKKAVVIVGDPGSGKSTFLKRIATILSRAKLNKEPDNTKKKLGLDSTTFPVFIRLFDLFKHIEQCMGSKEQGCPTGDDNPAWLFHYLGRLSGDRRWELSREWFEKQSDTESGIIILLDGLDEAPDTQSRNTLVRLVNKLQSDCDSKIIVTSRPIAYEEGIQLKEFFRCDIAPLDDDGVNTFLRQWCDALYYDSTEIAISHFEKLQQEVFARAAIRRMAANPVMLTALAVLHWNNKKLPEQRAELYESVIGWLLDSRDLKRPARTSREECREHLQAIALAMQEWKGGRQQSLERGEMIDLLEGIMYRPEEQKPRLKAQRFIENEELDSGIIRARGSSVEFWHLTFLEYLAARELAGMNDKNQQEKLLKPEILDDPSWRETLLLFIGVLWGQGRRKVEGFFSAMIDHLEKLYKHTPAKEMLSLEARCFGLMGAMLRDLQPFEYTVEDVRFAALRERVEGIFDTGKAKMIDTKVRVAAADALGQAGDHRIVVDLRTQEAKDKMFIEIPAGEFWMGAQKEYNQEKNYDQEAYGDESPVHLVSLKSFLIGRYPVTVSQYELFVNEEGYLRDVFWQAGGKNNYNKPEEWEQQLSFPNRPVIGVSWFEAMAFCMWAGIRLPSEAEWERAARGPGVMYQKYPWGNEPIDPLYANYNGAGISHASPVGCFPGGNTVWNLGVGLWLSDMVGNVWEWCSDWKGDYRLEPDSDLSGGKPDYLGLGRVLRGGSWDRVPKDCRCTYRSSCGPVGRRSTIGFRVVRSQL